MCIFVSSDVSPRAPRVTAPWLGLALLAVLALRGFLLAEPGAANAAEPGKSVELPGPPKFELVDGDRVVLIGGTLIEREQRYGYLEAGLVSHFPGRKITVRNLGWSGDTVWGEARSGDGPPEGGFKHLVEQIAAAEPTVIIACYGANEALAGPAGLEHFREGLNNLLDALTATGARVVLLSPLRRENLGPPLPDPAVYNEHLRLYCAAVSQAADERHLLYANLFDAMITADVMTKDARVTDNGIHLTAAGYWRAAPKILAALGLPDVPWKIEIDGRAGKVLKASGTEVLEIASTRQGLRFRTRDLIVAEPRPPFDTPELFQTSRAGHRVLRVTGLDGTWTLLIDGKPLDTLPADDWNNGVVSIDGPAVDQADRLRRQIVAKDELFFHRWRPQNQTYLFGHRKHEQGNNAVEIPKFDPLVASKDTRIRELAVPVEHQYELIPK